LLRESCREAGKVKHRTIANLEETEAIRLGLRRKADLLRIVAAGDAGRLELVGVWLLLQLARDLGVAAALRSDSKRACSIRARACRRRPCRSLGHAAGAALGMIGFDEDDLYANVWIAWRKERSTSKPGYLLAESRRLRRMSFSTT
jgi:hypothetical protein